MQNFKFIEQTLNIVGNAQLFAVVLIPTIGKKLATMQIDHQKHHNIYIYIIIYIYIYIYTVSFYGNKIA